MARRDDLTGPNRPKSRLNRRGLVAVGIGMAIALLLGWLLWSRSSDGEVQSVPTSIEPGPTTSSPSTTTTSSASPDLTWKQYANGVWLPYSLADGPTNEDEGLASGFGHTERGALLAAIHIAGRSSSFLGPSIYRPTIQRQVVGADAAMLLRNTEAWYASDRTKYGVADGAPIPSAPGGELVAAKVELRSPDVATVQFVATIAPGSSRLFNTSVTVQWEADDWRLVAPVNGDWSSTSSELPVVPASFQPFRKGA